MAMARLSCDFTKPALTSANPIAIITNRDSIFSARIRLSMTRCTRPFVVFQTTKRRVTPVLLCHRGKGWRP